MVVIDSTTLNKIYFTLEDSDKGYEVDEEDQSLLSTIVAEDSITVVSMKCNQLGATVQKSKRIEKDTITGLDIVKALVKCENQLRNKYGIIDPDHVFFEGFFCSDGDSEVVCAGWGS